MTTNKNRRWLLASRPSGMVDASSFSWVEEPVPEVGDGEILVRNLYLSADPTQRGWMARDTYMPAVKIGEVMRSFGLGRVEASRNAGFAVGELVTGLLGWQDYALVSARSAAGLAKVPSGVPIPLAMGVFGITGMTAYFGLMDVGKPVSGQTVLVSGAAGATGSVVGQIARIQGCRAIGTAGGQDKCAWLVREAGFDVAIDYKTEDVGARLKELCPNGVDVYFDNVGGPLLEVVLDHLALHARIVMCGAIAAYNDTGPTPGPRNLINLLVKRARIEGIVLTDFLKRAPEALAALGGWVAGGRIVTRVDVQEGLENAPSTLARLFKGENVGKQLLKIAEP